MLQASSVVVVSGASSQTLGKQAASVVVLVPLHKPSVPMYTAQVVAVPLYVLHAVNAETQVLPFVLQLA